LVGTQVPKFEKRVVASPQFGPALQSVALAVEFLVGCLLLVLSFGAVAMANGGSA
jgi:hypothetical protein